MDYDMTIHHNTEWRLRLRNQLLKVRVSIARSTTRI